MKVKKLDKVGQEIFEKRYAYVGETSYQDRCRVMAHSIASAEKDEEKQRVEDAFYDILSTGDFVPGGRIIKGAGTKSQNMLNCYVLIPEDNVESIGKVIQDAYRISCAGGGIGFNFSKIRPKGDDIQHNRNSAPGSVSVMRMINEIGNHVRAGGNRRTALMGILNVTHPDILEFLHVKLAQGELTNFNISVAVTNRFLEAVKANEDWYFTFGNKKYYVYNVIANYTEHNIQNGFNIKVIALNEQDALDRAHECHKRYYDDVFTSAKKIDFKARDLWDMIWTNAVKSGDPGIYNIDLANEYTNVSYFEELLSTNPCYAKGSLVLTPKGFKKIEDISKGDSISTIYGSGDVKEVEVHKSIPVFKVKLSDGSIHRVTASHQFHAYKKEEQYGMYREIQLKDLSVGDTIRISPGNIDEGANKLAPDGWSEYQYGLFNGILLGDGCYTESVLNRNSVKVASNIDDVEWNKIVIDLLQKAGSKNINTYQNKDQRGRLTKSISINSQDGAVATLVLEEGYLNPTKAINKEIPLEFLQSNKEFLLGLLDGLICTDGNVNLKSSQPAIRFKTASNELAQGFRRICLLLGLHARIYSGMRKEHFIDGRRIRNDNPYYEVHITGDCLVSLANIMILSDPVKQEKLVKIKKFCASSSNRFRAQIESIEPDGDEEVYDLYESDSDTWIVDGAVSRGCGEISLPNYGNCCLGNVNLSNMVVDGQFDWKRFAKAIRYGLQFLDNVLEINHFPIPECREAGHRSRRVGLGVMGYHYMLLKLGLKYGSEKCLEFTDRLAMAFRDMAYLKSIYLAREKGPFQAFNAKAYLDEGFAKTLPARIRMLIKDYGIRNAVMLTIPPTGTISMLMGVSSGIEPIFSPIYKRRWRDSNVWKEVVIVDPLLRQFWEEDLPIDSFIGAYDITPKEHLAVQVCWQRYIDSCISKTINLPSDSKAEELSDLALEHSEYLKGLTIYRAGSKGGEPLEQIELSQANLEKYLNSDKVESEVADGAVCKMSGECSA